MWVNFKNNVARVMKSSPLSYEILAKTIATEYDNALKLPPAGDLVARNSVDVGNVLLFENIIKTVFLRQSSSILQLDVINGIANGFVGYWSGATLKSINIPLIPAPGAILNTFVINNQCFNPGIQTSIPFTYEGLYDVEPWIDKLIQAADLHLLTISGATYCNCLYPGGVSGVGLVPWNGFSVTGADVDLSQLNPSGFVSDPAFLEKLNKSFSGLVNVAELAASGSENLLKLQEEVSSQTLALDGMGGEIVYGNISGLDLSGEWVKICAAYVSKNEGFTEISSWDVNAYRLGFGTDKILLENGTIKTVLPTPDYYKQTGEKKVPPPIGMQTTRERALKMLEHDLVNRFRPRVVGNKEHQLTEDEWNKLSEPAKAALVSYAYNAGSLRVKIATAIKREDYSLAAQYIKEGPIKGGDVVYPGLIRRRAEESAMFTSQPLPFQLPTDITTAVASADTGTDTTTNTNSAG